MLLYTPHVCSYCEAIWYSKVSYHLMWVITGFNWFTKSYTAAAELANSTLPPYSIYQTSMFNSYYSRTNNITAEIKVHAQSALSNHSWSATFWPRVDEFSVLELIFHILHLSFRYSHIWLFIPNDTLWWRSPNVTVWVEYKNLYGTHPYIYVLMFV